MGIVLAAPRRILGGGVLFGTLSLALAGCAAPGVSAPQRLADRITRAVYANDLSTTVDLFDDTTKAAITRAELGGLSDRMHALGDFKSIVSRDGNPDTGRYEFDASFTGGMMLVQMRIDPSGKVGAYRIVPEEISTPPTRSAQG
ncbi:MAG: hypothetical protein NVS2B3_16120 [Vulcanimicrobiaceae bacterium]